MDVMKLPVSITKFAKQTESLPLDKIIRPKEFHVDHLSKDALIPEDDETITPSNFGTLLDFLTRYIILYDINVFDLANIELKRYLDAGLISSDDFEEMVKKEERLQHLAENIPNSYGFPNLDRIPDEVFNLGLDICAWEIAFRSGIYKKPVNYPNKITIEHLKLMMKRIDNFFMRYGRPRETAFTASTKNGYLSGDGDYLLSHTIIDLKASNKTTMQPYWVRQLLLYYTLGFYNHFNERVIKRLMIYNARVDTVFYINVTKVDKSVFEFVNDAAEKQSSINEQVISQLNSLE